MLEGELTVCLQHAFLCLLGFSFLWHHGSHGCPPRREASKSLKTLIFSGHSSDNWEESHPDCVPVQAQVSLYWDFCQHVPATEYTQESEP